MPNLDPDPFDKGTGPTHRAVKAAWISRQMKAYRTIPSPTVVEQWLIEFGRLTKREKLDFYNRMIFTQ